MVFFFIPKLLFCADGGTCVIFGGGVRRGEGWVQAIDFGRLDGHWWRKWGVASPTAGYRATQCGRKREARVLLGHPRSE